MKIFIVLLLIAILFLDSSLILSLVLAIDAIWLLITIFNYYKIIFCNDKKIITNEYLTNIPNNNEACYIRYLYTGKIDEKLFFISIIELILNKEISIINEDGNYFLIDNENNLNLSKSEEQIKKILFNTISNTRKILVSDIKCAFRNNSGYMYKLYNDWVHTFSYEAASYKYFKSTKSVKDKLIFYFVISFIIAIYNLLFVKTVLFDAVFTNILLFILIFAITSLLIYLVNNFVNREDDAKEELTNWIKLKNYIKKEDNELYKLDVSSLERYGIYSYALDCKKDFLKILDKCDEQMIKSSVLFLLMKSGIFDIIENSIVDSIKISRFNVIVLLKKNKGV